MQKVIIEKKDNSQKALLSEDSFDIISILKEDYTYIYDAIEEENFILKYSECNLFKELVYENLVVGFCTYDFSREFMTAALSNIYILPEFRGNRIFLEELEDTMRNYSKPSIMEPTRLVVETLISYGFAQKVNDRIVVSAIEFIVPGSHVLSNAPYDNDELSTHFYDLDMCACFHVLDLEKGIVAYSSPLNYDIVHYDCIENRQKMDDEYFSNIRESFCQSDVEFMKVILELEENLPVKNYTIDEIIGEGDEMSEYIQSLIDDGHVTYERALEIKQQIKEEYESGMILNESLLIRLAYLFENNIEPTIKSHDEVCPYCGMPIDSHDKFCHFCGINLDYDIELMQENLIKSINTSKSDFKEDIRFIMYKFLKLIDEKIDFEYAIFTIENTYNISWPKLSYCLENQGYLIDDSITERGYEFMNTHPLHFWEKYHMDIVDYTDFENYFYNHLYMNHIDICLTYLENFAKDEYVLEIIENIKSDL
ncbi:MAG: zinc ribbon domain-containing protein [Methanobrevibacter sp.]|uniref:zinc ribbon domain-containing protein n=1 Tax=Methanobrevibacter sp. TaxID=66852 RepID=UPI0025FB3D5C|nr:zinc ribbon domain-containing protein [Methanobrevibacter sp.]MBE6507795.1 zinc ribbon domain-containing protein [Methanobrevibacter sp.]